MHTRRVWTVLAGAAALGLGVRAIAQDKPPEAKTPPAPAAAPEKKADGAGPDRSLLLKPTDAAMNQQAPATFKAKFETTKGNFVIEVTRDWAPKGADRFYNLVKNGFFDDVAFFRCVKGFMVQFGITGDPKINAAFRSATIPDDPVKQSNKTGYITYAKSGQPNSRTTQVFINYKDNANLDSQGFAPFGKVVEGMDVVEKLNGEYGDGAPYGKGPDQGKIQMQGNDFLKKDFPNLDWVKKATIVQ
jgi:peptidyl-prolyl cis-trans isomerase A (cyclophilin A)